MAKSAAAIAQMTTTMIQEIRASGMAKYFHQMPPDAAEQHPREAASRALALLGEMAAEMRGGAILGADGEVLAADGSPADWAERVGELVGQADAAAEEGAEHIHIATEAGEVFLTRRDGLAAVAITERFVLASLMSFDMRAILGDLATELAGGAETAEVPS
jgi:predicted regulator of Ras-like GTPase activity (Roadblock/LC7/MglB family)